MVTVKGTQRPTHVAWSGNTPRASSATHAGGASGGERDSPWEMGDGVLGTEGDRILGASGTGGVGGGRPGHGSEQSSKSHQLKMLFSWIDGDQRRICKDKCLDYFRLFNVHPSLWLTSATLHMDGNAALWLRAYHLRHEVNSWSMLMATAEEKFAADDHHKFMIALLRLQLKPKCLKLSSMPFCRRKCSKKF